MRVDQYFEGCLNVVHEIMKDSAYKPHLSKKNSADVIGISTTRNVDTVDSIYSEFIEKNSALHINSVAIACDRHE